MWKNIGFHKQLEGEQIKCEQLKCEERLLL